MSEETKKCTKCGEVKEISLFGKNGKWIRGDCLECRRAHIKMYKIRFKETIQIARKKYHKENLCSEKERAAKYNRSEAARLRNVRNVANLNTGYVASSMRMRVSDCTLELIDLKREQLQFHRLAKEFNRTVKEVFK